MKRIVRILAAILVASGSGGMAQAELVITFQEVGGDVVNTASGSLDISGMVQQGTSAPFGASIRPLTSSVLLGPNSGVSAEYIYATNGGPIGFGTGDGVGEVPTSGSGDRVGLFGSGLFFVPIGYVSGSCCRRRTAYSGQTFNSLGLTPQGTYTYTINGPNAIRSSSRSARFPSPSPPR